MHFPDKAGQERFDQCFRLGRLSFLFGMNNGRNAVAMHHFLHLRRRNEVALLPVNFKKAKALFRGFTTPSARGVWECSCCLSCASSGLS